MSGALTSAILNGGLGLIGSVASTSIKSINDFLEKKKEFQLRELEYQMVREERMHELDMYKLKLESYKEYKTLNDSDSNKENATMSVLSELNGMSSDQPSANKIPYLPLNASWVDKLNACVRPYISIVLCTIFSICFASYIYKSLGQVSNIETFNYMLNTDFVKYGLFFIENIITFYFGQRSMKR